MSNNGSSRISLRFLNQAIGEINKLSEKLSSGKRINRASDDPAGLAIAEKLSSDAAVFKVASQNVDYAQSRINIADGALASVSDIATRQRELAAQASNGTLSDEQRASLNNEYQALSQEAERIAASTQFNGSNVFSGQSTSYQVGVDSGSNSQISVDDPNLSALLSSVSSGDISTQSGAQAALESSSDFISEVSKKRGQLGAVSSRLETARQNIDVATENLKSAESRIRDVDVAETIAKKTAADIRASGSLSVQAQSKLSAQNVLRLLK